MSRFERLMLFSFLSAGLLCAQSTTGTILGSVQDSTGGAVVDAKVTVRNLETNAVRTADTGQMGQFRFPQLPIGSYEVVVEKAGFSKYVQGPIVLRLNQDADLPVRLSVSAVTETVTVTTDAALINTTNAEVGVNFDAKRLSELPLAPNRNLLNIALSVPGVSQLSSGQSSFASSGNNGTESGVSFSANGMRLRSNNFMIDGQDVNSPSVSGLLQPLNNPDIVAEFRIITNQFAAEFGRAAGSALNIVTKSGTNTFHGSAFWFHNDNKLNTLSNLEKAARFTKAPFRIENQFGGTLGGPVVKDRTFFFVSAQRWTDRRLGAGSTINGAPTEEGRRALESIAANRPTVRALLENLPAGASNGQSRTVTADGRTLTVPLGNITGAASVLFNNWQYSMRVDHKLSERHMLGGRYLVDDTASEGTGQATPAGLTNVSPSVNRALSVFVNSSLSSTMFNEFRASYNRSNSSTNAANPAVAERIPSLEVTDLGLRGFNAVSSRTALGLAVNLPQFQTLNNYQLQNNLGILRGSHSMKFGVDFRRQEQFQFFNPTIRGRLEYANLQRLVDDQATVAQINAPLKGGERIQYFRYYDYFFYLQDEWRVKPNFTLTYGLRYESPGNPIASLAFYNQRVVAENGNDERYRLVPVPARDRNNWAPRFGFNYRFGQWRGPLGWLTGDGKLVIRGGYARTYDLIFNNIALNVGSAFPFVAVFDIPLNPAIALRPNAFAAIQNIRLGILPVISNPLAITRTIVESDFRSPIAEQFSLQFQRELARNYGFSAGYVATKGTALFQTVDGNPTVPGTGGVQRVDNTRGVIRNRCNCTASIYHSLQTSLEKRLSANFSMAAHYTWSAFIDGASEIFNPSNSGEIAVPQDSYNRRADRGRSSYDRPHRFTVNGVYELPFLRAQKGFAGKLAGGWQINGFLTFQAGASFSALMGADPGARVAGINGLVGTPIRPNLNTNLDLSGMSIEELRTAGGRTLFSPVTAAAPLGNLGRNVMRADGIQRLDFGIIKNTKLYESHTLQLHFNMFNTTNTRNFGIPEAVFTAPAFLNQWATDGSNRRIQFGLRYMF